jgi:sn-glycerol 3-phosphate transport system ATP-binding protein
MAQVELRKVIKDFEQNRVLQETNLVIPDGSFTVLVGPSGCGKTTTLRMIAGLDQASSGEISIGGQVVNNIPPGKRDIAMVFQNYALYPTMNVRDNIVFGIINKGVPKQEANKLVDEISEIVGLKHLLDRKPSMLSGGQRQRVALARAMVKQPQVFLMDEPLSNLDAKLRNQMRVELTAIHERMGTTFIYVTHDQVEAMTMGDQIVVMNEGVIQQVDSPMELYRNPKNLFVAQFIGSPAMNVVPIEATNEYVIGFRPEKAVISKRGAQGSNGENIKLQGHLKSREILGSEVLYYVDVDGTQVVVKSDPDQLMEIGDVEIQVAISHLYIFNKQSGERLADSLIPSIVSGRV